VDRIAIYGLGLLGGSLCRAVKVRNPRAKIYAFNRSRPALEKAKSCGAVDVILDRCALPDGGVDLAVVALPVRISVGIINMLLDNSRGSEIIIDVGSVKGGIVEGIIGHKNASRFVPCHPMAGSERTGFDASDPLLFKNASVIITPHIKNSSDDCDKVSDFWKSLDARVTFCDAAYHDRIVAFTSHLPQMVSSALALSVFESVGSNDLLPFTGKGFRDMTRLAAGSAEMWTEIGFMNAQAIIEAIDMCMNELEKVRGAISQKGGEPKLHDFLDQGALARRGIINE
jgi:prephenate dehydrogenase